ncbi:MULTISPECIES: DUF7314 family protein [Haloprofundus]|uniref:DUF7314 family protein n=1 Tax=Haloprofundus TaxID=1911573 RepID=UPI000E4394E5|nr:MULTISPECIES: hypothetical protein [Haloprofundus]QCJ47647.1 hypothetical protein FCF25_11180 [Haloprofundus sp. MHR1]
MADEFIKGLTIATAAGLGWMVLAGWYRTSSFESAAQLVEPVTVEGPDLFNGIAIALMDVLLWFAILGALTFWVLIPVGRELRASYSERRSQ